MNVDRIQAREIDHHAVVGRHHAAGVRHTRTARHHRNARGMKPGQHCRQLANSARYHYNFGLALRRPQEQIARSQRACGFVGQHMCRADDGDEVAHHSYFLRARLPARFF